MSRGRVLAALSGGVDSATAAALLIDAGYEVVGATLRLLPPDGEASPFGAGCCSPAAADAARRVCQTLGIPFYLLSFEREFEACVIEPFCRAYATGRTPNPCLWCNQRIKFGRLLERARALGFDYIATGHYARLERDTAGAHLLKGVDAAKDQSYCVYMLGPTELAPDSGVLMPLGGLRKTEVRAIARRRGLPVWNATESQDICFVPPGGLASFLTQRVAVAPGPLRRRDGTVLGAHRGLAHYTVGQRHGLGLDRDGPWFVVALDAATNSVVVGRADELDVMRVQVADLSFVAGESPPTPLRLTAKLRYRATEAPGELRLDAGGATFVFEAPQRAAAPGQAIVFYDGERVVGGGVIVAAGIGDDPRLRSLGVDCAANVQAAIIGGARRRL